MCGIFGLISENKVNQNHLKFLSGHARQRGRDSSGLIHFSNNEYKIKRADFDINKLLSKNKIDSNLVLGHSRLITNGLHDNQPVLREGCFLIHNGIIVNYDEVWKEIELSPNLKIDSEVILGVAIKKLNEGCKIEELSQKILFLCKGTIACALAIPEKGKLILFSNNGSLYVGKCGESVYFSSERFPLDKLLCENIKQVWHEAVVLEIPKTMKLDVTDENHRTENLIPAINKISSEEAMLKYEVHKLKRCTKCILPETMQVSVRQRPSLPPQGRKG